MESVPRKVPQGYKVTIGVQFLLRHLHSKTFFLFGLWGVQSCRRWLFTVPRSSQHLVLVCVFVCLFGKGGLHFRGQLSGVAAERGPTPVPDDGVQPKYAVRGGPGEMHNLAQAAYQKRSPKA